jgi:hypothetical protein
MSDHHYPGAAVGWLRAKSPADGLAGCAFLVTPDLVLTCAHVVAEHLGLDNPAPDVAPTAHIVINFEAIGIEVTGRVIPTGWFSNAKAPLAGPADIAFIRLDHPVPDYPGLPALAGC